MGCNNLSATASGRLFLNLAKNQAEYSLNSNEFSLRTALEFSQKNQLQKHITSDNEVRINGEAVQMDKLAVRGGIFGSESQNVGLVSAFVIQIPMLPASHRVSENSLPFPAFFQADITKITDRKNGAGDGVRTRDLKLGKLALYQLSYTRIFCPTLGWISGFCQENACSLVKEIKLPATGNAGRQ